MPTTEPFVLQLRPLTWPQRRRHYLRLLRRPGLVGVLLFVAFLPVILDRAVALLIPSEPLSPSLVVLGFAGIPCVLVLALMMSETFAAAARLFGRDPGSLVFLDDGIHEVRGRHVKEHPWTWIVEARQVGDSLVLSCGEPLRTLRLGGGGRRELVVDRRTPEAERLEQLLEAHRPGVLRRHG